MIKLRHIHKYFNKGKTSEIHAVNDINFDFPETGLVCMLGSSGCGKTTLLNIIGGLDKPTKGEIKIKEKTISRYAVRRWDLIRSRYFGYVFQNYYLLPELTVYQNLEFVLKTFSLTPTEIQDRIAYALAAVGMYKYRKRKPYQLSGGQQQRIAIARALVKSPAVVVADEPTGNLDEKNKTQIMNIIKKISAECLVILVTHEQRLAEFYGDTIVELLDGKIVNARKNNAGTGELTADDDRNIYLPEYTGKEMKNEDISIKYFYKDQPAPIKLNLVYQNGIYYLYDTGNETEIKLIDDRSEVKIIDGPRPVINRENWYKFDYYLPPLRPDVKAVRSAINYKDTFKLAWRWLGRMRRSQKFMMTLLVLAAIMVVFAFSNLFSATRVDETEFLRDNRNLVEIKGTKDYTVTEYQDLKETLGVDFILAPSAQMAMQYLQFDYFFPNTVSFSGHSVLPIALYGDITPIEGRLPANSYEVVIDKYLVDIMLEQSEMIESGARYYRQFINCEYLFGDFQGQIVGVVNTGNPNIYMRTDDYREVMINHLNDEAFNLAYIMAASNAAFTEYYDIDDYGNPEATASPFSPAALTANQIIVSSAYIDLYGEDLSVNVDKTYEILGYYPDDKVTIIVVPNANLEEMSYHFLKENPTVFASDKKEMIERLAEHGLDGKDLYRIMYQEQYAYNFSFTKYIFSLVILLGSMLFLYFLMRSSLIRRIYEVGVYRALGVKKTDIYRLFLAEIIILTAITAIIGVGLITYLINQINGLSPFTLIYFPWYIPIISIVFIFAVNIVTGLLPVIFLFRHTPAQILSKYDI